MLRVGLTGELGSGKSTVLRMLAGFGAHTMSSDEIGRDLMQPGQVVYNQIVAHFGPSLLLPNGELDRPALARLAFDPIHPRVEELNAIVHPAVLSEQQRRLDELACRDPHAIAVIESALIFTTRYAGPEPWRTRFDRILVVTAPDELKIQRFVARSQPTGLPEAELRTDALARLERQRLPLPNDSRILLLPNNGNVASLQQAAQILWQNELQPKLPLGEPIA